jgi:hypothetical protein
VAPSNSGKTVLAKNILKHVDGMLKIPPTKILFCYTVYQPLYDEMKKEIPLIEFHQDFPQCMLQDILCFQILKEKNKVSFIFYLQSKFYCHKCIFEKEHDE